MPMAAPPGWYAILEGEAFDLEDWRQSLKEPFDPVAEQLPDGKTVLRSSAFENLEEPDEVRQRALVLIARMNGAMGLVASARTVRMSGILHIDEEGKEVISVSAILSGVAGRCRVSGVGVTLGV